MPSLLTRREVLHVLGWLGFGAVAGCAKPSVPRFDRPSWLDPPDETISFDASPEAEANVRALMDVLLPAERDGDGNLISPGALEAGAFDTLGLRDFLPAAIALGFVRNVPAGLESVADGFDSAIIEVINADLNALANVERPGRTFANMERDEQIRAVKAGFADNTRRLPLQYVRAVSMISYLGAVHSDVGLQAIGFPPFENFDDRLAVSGYPRTRSGRLIDVTTESLAALAAAGDLDDYTYNRAPMPTPDDDLSSVIDANGFFR